jgi:DNA-binding PadR family transcriptional regulator
MARKSPLPRAKAEDLTLNPTAASLLGFLHVGPMTGWELLEAVDRSIGYFWNVTKSHVYRELQSLEVRGLVVAGPVGPRQSRPLSLTRAGRAAFAWWISQEPGQELIRFPLLVTMFFGAHLDPDRLESFLAIHRRRHEERVVEYEQFAEMLEGAPRAGPSAVPGMTDQNRRFALATVRLGLEYEHAVLRWFDARPWDDSAAAPASTTTAGQTARGRQTTPSRATTGRRRAAGSGPR